ncbi:hypothetical protein M011DRAFT_464402 [Sporormia fimetaria CBS 119925]|uniref:TAFII55 protein conserved region domain-containing protein n=1 Tax=Sporormia fimetaria CBS 119925 TaxID=1340428 RepID=A0A6A6VJ07_9PLEO|nr:hypothetical protein M011DRAFT_464402 [Sporormia fimetaria CBS 119925]
MKLKLSAKAAAPSADGQPTLSTPAASQSTASATQKIKLKVTAPAATAPAAGDSAEAPRQKRKYTKKPKADEHGNPIPPTPKTVKIKKRTREDNGDEAAPTSKRKPKPTAKSLEAVYSSDELDDEDMMVPATAPRITLKRGASKLKLKMNTKGQEKTPQIQVVKIKGAVGKPQERPLGVGYDSEAEDAEIDPALEHQFVLRMQPGDYCDTLRTAIEEKKIGKNTTEGGTSVYFRFFDREGRRAMVSIHPKDMPRKYYAAAMVDLPCVIESMKSWNRKDWVKTADVCQMLLVLGEVQSEEEAKKYPLPYYVDPHKHQYPHGLTPPMHWVRKRRFRPRQSYHEIEQREAKVNELFDDDEAAREKGGEVAYEVVDERDQTDSESEGEDIAETTEYVIEGQTPGGDEIEIDNDDLAKALAEGLMEDDDDDGLFGGDTIEVETETPVTAHEVAAHALGESFVSAPETAASSPGAPTSPDDDDDDDDDGDSEAGEVDAEAAAAQEGLEQSMAEIRELEQEIAKAQEQFDNSTNILYKQRCKRRIEQLQTDLQVKKTTLGIGDDGD